MPVRLEKFINFNKYRSGSKGKINTYLVEINPNSATVTINGETSHYDLSNGVPHIVFKDKSKKPNNNGNSIPNFDFFDFDINTDIEGNYPELSF